MKEADAASTSGACATAVRFCQTPVRTAFGQVLVLDVDERGAAEKIVTGNQFVQAGLFESRSSHRFRISVESGSLT